MPETKRRTKKDPHPPAETATPPPGQTRVTLTKDVSSRYRKLVPRAKAGGAIPSRPPHSKGQATRPEHGAAPPKPPRRNGPGPGGRHRGTLKALLQRELPEMARQIRETQNLLRTAAEGILTLLEEWTRRPPEETRAPQALVTALLEKMSFHDLAGQRLAKVENFLKALAETTPPDASADRFPPRRAKPFSKADQAGGRAGKPGPGRARTQEKTALKGPQEAGGGLDQGEVESLLADLGQARPPND
jgi:hypothetical protein